MKILSKIKLCALSLLFIASSAHAMKFGTEQDLLPYLNNGWYASIWAGENHFRARFVLTNVEVPKLGRPSNISYWEMDAKAYLVDYFFKTVPEGLWVGAGLETWKNKVRQNGDEQNFSTTIFTLGSGYIFNISKNFYINPWIAIHSPIGGATKKDIGGETFKMRSLTAEGSFKVGFYF